MGEILDRRTRKKAQTRDHIRSTAQQLFADRGFEAVTIADVAAAADVAVQTVFNHFASKEDLFFANRAPWIEGIADTVRTRCPETPPLPALRAALLHLVATYLERASTPEHRRFMTTLQASAALQSFERQLHHEAECRVRQALTEAWQARTNYAADEYRPDDAQTSAALIAAIWLAGIRALLLELRSCPPEPDDIAAKEAVLQSAAELLDRLENGLPSPHASVPPGRVPAGVSTDA